MVDAEIDGRVGGTYRVSWGEGMDGISDITVFEPERHFQVRHRPMEGSPDLPTGAIVEEYFIERDGDRTVLRLVTSNIPDTEDWDWFYEGTKRGWRIFLLALRHYLEHHFGRSRDHAVSMVGLPGSIEEAWPRLVGSEGLGIADSLEGASAGDLYEGTTAFGDSLAGTLLLLDPPYRLLATVDGMNNALLGATLEQMGENNFLYLSLSTFGLDAGEFAEIKSRWESWVNGLFPEAVPAAEAFTEVYGTAEGASD